ncbi:MAG: DUF4258 domain-containing protein [Calditrichaeota bacterium]|nr:MAG: DUF4258 domain-containing protein [Calditrichota bacterium]
MQLQFTPHARKRMHQRGIKMADVQLALARGQRIYARDTLFVFLGRRQLIDLGNLAERLEGLTLVIDPKTKTLLTVFRNRRFTRKIRYKPRHRARVRV